MKYILLILLLISSSSQASWAELNYDTSSECFTTGIKRVFVPFPGFGTFACAKDIAQQLPDYKKSFNLLAGHTAGLVGAGLASFLMLVAGAYLEVPIAREVLGRELTKCLVNSPQASIIKMFRSLQNQPCENS